MSENGESVSKKTKSVTSRSVVAVAPVNIATIKYWGKSNEKYILPLNESISVTIDMDEMCTKTSITATRKDVCNGEATGDTLILNGSETKLTSRMESAIKKMREEAQKAHCVMADWKLNIDSWNNFPTAAGLASSASGMACLVFTLQQLFELKGNFSHVARLGSGSACRSYFGGFVEWTNIDDDEQSGAEVICGPDHWQDLRILICVASDRPKLHSSTSGMQSSVKTSSLLSHRINEVLPDRLNAMRAAIRKRDFPSFAELTMKDSNQLHAICLDTFPPISYLTSASHRVIRLVHFLNETAGRPIAAYTFDAGPNAFVFVQEKDVEEVVTALKRTFPRRGQNGALEEVTVRGCHVGKAATTTNTQEETMVDGLKEILCVRVGEGPRLLSSTDA